MRRNDAYLLDMLLAARDAREFAADLSFPDFKRHRMAQLAILKSLEVSGEAVSRVSSEGRKALLEIPWLQIIRIRNRLVHGYFDVNLLRVWETVQEDIPRLIVLLEPRLTPESG